MFSKIKSIAIKTDRFLYKKFGSNKGTKFLENIKEARIIFSRLNEIGEKSKVMFVGGCVRKSITGENVDDIDLATIYEPEQIKEKLDDKDIKIIDTGISHGTVTAILNKKKFEITTLRKDVSTDGRHALVEYTKNWEQDASRRDFTINAIYADIEGRIYDPLNGMHDLEKGIVKFIGLAEERIQEDYLRILRYFRFFTQYSKADHDQQVVGKIKQYINGINNLSNERIFDELKKIMALKNVDSIFSNETSKEIITNIFPQFQYSKRLEKIKKISPKIRSMYDDILILALLIVDDTDNYEYFCHKFKTSKSIKSRFKNISENFSNLSNSKFYSEANIKKLIYFSNKDYVKDLILFSASLNNKAKNFGIEKLLNYVDFCKIPKFPISGDYLKQYGYKSGPNLGEKLKLLEQRWIENDFIIKKESIEKSLGKENKD